MSEITLKEVCKTVGVTRRAVQGYEKEGVVAASGKNKYGYLLYDENAVEKIREIKQYQDFGFSVKQIKIILSATDEIKQRMFKERLEKLECDLKKLEKNIGLLKDLLAEQVK